MGSKTKIFIVLEFVTGGELFDKIVSQRILGQCYSCTSFASYLFMRFNIISIVSFHLLDVWTIPI